MKAALALVLALFVGGCVTIPATRDGEDPAKTFRTSVGFMQMGDCLYEKVRVFWLQNSPDTIPKTDLAEEVRFEQQIPLSYAVGHGWTISVRATSQNTSEVRLFEGQRGFNRGAELYDDALPRFVRECDAKH